MIALSAPEIAIVLMGGALIGFLLGLFGGGGSVLATPFLLYVVGVADAHVAIGTAGAAVAANAAVNLIGHWRAGRVKWPCAITFGLAGVAGSLAGATVAKLTPAGPLMLAFAVAMAAIALSMMRKPASAGNPDVHITPTLMARLTPLGLVTGFAAGFFGIGGGFLIVPGLMVATGMTLTHAAASSLVSVALFGASTSFSYALSGLVDWGLAGLLLAGGALGGIAGSGVARRLAGQELVLRRAFAVLVLLVAAYVAWRSIAAL